MSEIPPIPEPLPEEKNLIRAASKTRKHLNLITAVAAAMNLRYHAESLPYKREALLEEAHITAEHTAEDQAVGIYADRMEQERLLTKPIEVAKVDKHKKGRKHKKHSAKHQNRTADASTSHLSPLE